MRWSFLFTNLLSIYNTGILLNGMNSARLDLFIFNQRITHPNSNNVEGKMLFTLINQRRHTHTQIEITKKNYFTDTINEKPDKFSCVNFLIVKISSLNKN